MKRCPECRRDYLDETLVYCLDDGSRLLDGPREGSHGASSEQPTKNFEPPTQIFKRDAEENGVAETAPKRTVLFVSLGAILLAAIAGLGFYLYRPAPGRVNEIRSVAVLPLENLSNDASQEFFADGMTEALISNLSRVGSIKVISRTSVMRYKRSGKSVPEIARELGVDGVIEGSVQRSGERVRVSAQLVHAGSDSPVWSNTYERTMSDILKLQSEISQALVNEIRAQLTDKEKLRLERSKPINPAATEAFLLGRHYLHKWTRESERQAIEQFEKAVSVEPEYAEAWAALADAWQIRSIVGDVRVREAEQPARAAALKALEIDPDISAAHVSMCFIHNNYDFDWVRGEAACRRGIDLDPNNAKARFAYAYLLARLERWAEVSQHMEQAMKVDPAEPWWPSVYGSFLIQARRFEESERNIQKAIAIDPNWAASYNNLLDLYVETGRYDAALDLYRSRQSLSPLTLSYIYARKGDRQKAMETLNSSSKEDLYESALVYAAMDDRDKSFEVINRSLDRGEGFMFGYGNFLVLDKLKTDPRWGDVRRRMNLPQ